MKWEIRRVLDQDFDGVQVYQAKAEDCTNWFHAPAVWWTQEAMRANCVECSGPLVAMSTSCAHARAVKRFALKSNQVGK